jgi:hypothetical protein
MRVKFVECSDAQANWGGYDDPRESLEVGEVYEVEEVEQHSWSTLYRIKGKEFNSVCFTVIEESGAV